MALSAGQLNQTALARSVRFSEQGGSNGQGSRKVVHFKISAHTKDRKKITIAEDVDGEDLAYSYKEFLERKLGIDSSRSR